MSTDTEATTSSHRPNFILDFGGSQYINRRQTNVLRAQAQGFGNQLAAMCADTTAGTYALITLTPKWPPISSLLVISIERGAVLPNRVLPVMQLSESRYQPIPIAS